VNFSDPFGPPDGERDVLDDDNVTAIMVELPKECLLSAPDKPIIGAWTTASKIDGTNIAQVSRLGMPLVNELVSVSKTRTSSARANRKTMLSLPTT